MVIFSNLEDIYIAPFKCIFIFVNILLISSILYNYIQCLLYYIHYTSINWSRDRCGRMLVRLTTTCVVGSNPAHGEVYSIQHYMITVLPVLFKYCYKYCYSDSWKL